MKPIIIGLVLWSTSTVIPLAPNGEIGDSTTFKVNLHAGHTFALQEMGDNVGCKLLTDWDYVESPVKHDLGTHTDDCSLTYKVKQGGVFVITVQNYNSKSTPVFLQMGEN